MKSTEDDYAHEEEGERRAMVKNLHVPMKIWYNSNNCKGILEKYGKFPMFWQELEGWTNFKQILKLYMYASDRQQLHDPLDLEKLELAVAEKHSTEASENGVNSTDAPSSTQGSGDDPRKRRRNRWGVGPDGATATALTVPEVKDEPPAAGDEKHVAEEDTVKKKKSRWSVAVDPVAPSIGGATVPAMMSHEAIQQTMVYQMQLKQITEKLGTVVQDALAREQDPERSPSPPPRYDGNGKRVNTREVRMREALAADRTRVIEDLMKLNPLYQPPADFVKVKPFKKVYIPIKEHPNYNFIGLIIGPRGNTQRRLEKDTGAKVSIRGKGSVKEGRKNQMKGPDDDDELHVHIQGETEESVSAAVKLVQELLVPVDDEKNEHKQKQLRELALINGTLREDEFCQVCGERGHKQFECPHRSKTFKAANVKCAICGEQSHPTRDCPLKESGPTNEIALDSEYSNFMAELDGGKAADTSKSKIVASDGLEEAPNDSTELSKEENGVVMTERFLNGNKKQTIIHAKTLMTGWSATPQTPVGVTGGQYWPGAQAYSSSATFDTPSGTPSNGFGDTAAASTAAWNAAALQYSYPGMYQAGPYGTAGAYGMQNMAYPQQYPHHYYSSAPACNSQQYIGVSTQIPNYPAVFPPPLPSDGPLPPPPPPM